MERRGKEKTSPRRGQEKGVLLERGRDTEGFQKDLGVLCIPNTQEVLVWVSVQVIELWAGGCLASLHT